MIEQYQAQINFLAAKLNCRLDVDPKFRTTAMMYVESGYIEVPPITDQISYLITLHELGHVAEKHTQPRSDDPHAARFYFDNGVLHSEAQAWSWALDHCLDEVQPTSRTFMWDQCLGSYYKVGYLTAAGKPTRLLNGNRHHVEFVFDEPDDYFTAIVARIQNGIDPTLYTIKYDGRRTFQA